MERRERLHKQRSGKSEEQGCQLPEGCQSSAARLRARLHRSGSAHKQQGHSGTSATPQAGSGHDRGTVGLAGIPAAPPYWPGHISAVIAPRLFGHIVDDYTSLVLPSIQNPFRASASCWLPKGVWIPSKISGRAKSKADPRLSRRWVVLLGPSLRFALSPRAVLAKHLAIF